MTDLIPRRRILDHAGFAFDLDSEGKCHIMAPEGTAEKGLSLSQCDELLIALRMLKELVRDEQAGRRLAGGDDGADAAESEAKKETKKLEYPEST